MMRSESLRGSCRQDGCLDRGLGKMGGGWREIRLW